jgi:tetratricopeptide (TPR) repeat protein
MLKDFSSKPMFFSISLLLLIVACISAYYNSLDVPFYLDDVSSITNNPEFVEGTSFSSLFAAYGMRVVGYMTLWWDYSAAGLDPQRYHIVNVVIHLLSSISVFFFTVLLQQAAARKLKVEPDSLRVWILSLVVALIFVTHPLQSQAVTYIVQRLASLTALFYIASLTAYMAARLSKTFLAQGLLFLVACCFALLAIFTKQNAVTIPIVILLIELLFFTTLKIRWLIWVPSVLVVVIVALYLMGNESVNSIVNTVDRMTRENQEMTRWQYFSAQLPILWEYVSKFYAPSRLHLEYDYSIDSFSATLKWVSGIAHLCVLFFAIAVVKRFPLISFGIFFYYLAHSVESGLIPITDLAFEHRNYLPNLGLIILTVFAVNLVLQPLNARVQKIALVSVGSLIILLSILTFNRNQVWQDPKVFYQNELTHNPTQYRILQSYAEILIAEGSLDEAMVYLNRLYEAADGKVDGAVFNTHLLILMNQRKYEEAIELGSTLLEKPLHPSARSVILSNLGIIFVNLQDHAKAKPYFDEAIKYGVLPVNSLIAYAYTLYVLNELELAQSIMNRVMRVQPDAPRAQQLIQMIKTKQQNQE